MDFEDFANLVKTRRSVRGFQSDREVPEEVIRKIIDVARWAPSGGNGQPWEFIVIRDQETRQRIFELFQKQSELSDEMERAVRGRARGSATGFRHAPVYILIIGDPRTNQSFPVRTQIEKGHQHFITGLASATLLIHLAAHALGLSTQYLSACSSPYMATMLRVMLGIPEYYHIYEMVILGYGVKTPPPTPRRSVDEITHWDRYQEEKSRTDAQIQSFLMAQTRLGNYGRGNDIENSSV